MFQRRVGYKVFTECFRMTMFRGFSQFFCLSFCLSLSLRLIAEAATRIARLLPPADKRARQPRHTRASPSCPAHLFMTWARLLMARLFMDWARLLMARLFMDWARLLMARLF
ncbi:hypothetical protein CsSME_00007222 [Camellia sinensis var. sinensis]